VIRCVPHPDDGGVTAEGAGALTLRHLLTVNEAARYLGISRTMVFKLLKSDALESVMIGTLRRVSIEQLQRFIQSQMLRG